MANRRHAIAESSLTPAQLKRRGKKGWQRKFKDQQDLWDKAVSYFEFVETNPLLEQKLVANGGEHELMDLPKMRAMSIDGFLLHCEVARRTWTDYQNLDEFADAVAAIEATIRTQKFEGAAANLLNSNIISRDLELVDKTSNEHGGIGGGPVATFNFIPVGPDDS